MAIRKAATRNLFNLISNNDFRADAQVSNYAKIIQFHDEISIEMEHLISGLNHYLVHPTSSEGQSVQDGH
jgi:hypothetical protein